MGERLVLACFGFHFLLERRLPHRGPPSARRASMSQKLWPTLDGVFGQRIIKIACPAVDPDNFGLASLLGGGVCLAFWSLRRAARLDRGIMCRVGGRNAAAPAPALERLGRAGEQAEPQPAGGQESQQRSIKRK